MRHQVRILIASIVGACIAWWIYTMKTKSEGFSLFGFTFDQHKDIKSKERSQTPVTKPPETKPPVTPFPPCRLEPKGKYGCNILGGVLTGTEVVGKDGKPMCQMCYKDRSHGIIIPGVKGQSRGGKYSEHSIKYKIGNTDVVTPLESKLDPSKQFLVGDLVELYVKDDGFPGDLASNTKGPYTYPGLCLISEGNPKDKTPCPQGPGWIKDSVNGTCTYCPKDPKTQCTFAQSIPAGPYRLCDTKNGFYASADTDNPYNPNPCAKCT